MLSDPQVWYSHQQLTLVDLSQIERHLIARARPVIWVLVSAEPHTVLDHCCSDAFSQTVGQPEGQPTVAAGQDTAVPS